jgi:hypothetical protein
MYRLNGNELSGSIKGGEFLDQLRDYKQAPVNMVMNIRAE